jgi:hypothetical protein
MIVCMYISPSGDFDQFSNLCDLTLKYLHNLNMEFMICGDFSISFLKDSHKKKKNLLFQTYNNQFQFSTQNW